MVPKVMPAPNKQPEMKMDRVDTGKDNVKGDCMAMRPFSRHRMPRGGRCENAKNLNKMNFEMKKVDNEVVLERHVY